MLPVQVPTMGHRSYQLGFLGCGKLKEKLACLFTALKIKSMTRSTPVDTISVFWIDYYVWDKFWRLILKNQAEPGSFCSLTYGSFACVVAGNINSFLTLGSGRTLVTVAFGWLGKLCVVFLYKAFLQSPQPCLLVQGAFRINGTGHKREAFLHVSSLKSPGQTFSH